jgi:hypothetical protein
MCKKKSIIVSCENDQELKDIETILSCLEGDVDLYRYDLSNVYGDTNKLKSIIKYKKTILAPAILGDGFRNRGGVFKFLIALSVSIHLLYFARKTKASYIFVGVPLVFFRLARIMSFSKLKTISLIRSLIVESKSTVSLSSQSFWVAKKIFGDSMLLKLFSDYYADLIFVSGDVSAKFIESRGVPKDCIESVGSISVDTMNEELSFCDSTIVSSEENIVFITSAFSWHGQIEAQKAQYDLINKIKRDVEKYNVENYTDLKLVVCVHPRDDARMYENLGTEVLIEANDSNFLCRYRNSLFLSILSTLSFELRYSGFHSYLISNDFFKKKYSKWYKNVDAEPITDMHVFLKEYFSLDKIREIKSFELPIEKVFSMKYKGHVSIKYAERLREQL